MLKTEQIHEELESLVESNKKEKFIGNEYYRDPYESIEKALSLYKEKHPENPLKFSGYPRVSDIEFIKMAAQIQLDRMQGKPAAMKNAFNEYLPEDLRNALSGAENDNSNLSFRYDIMHSIEELTEKSGEPLGVTELFYIFLADKKGNITQALDSAHEFFKDLSRSGKVIQLFNSEDPNWSAHGDPSIFIENGVQVLADEWFKKNIKDELALIKPYQELDASLYETATKNGEVDFNTSLRNQIGRMYHFFGILDSLDKMTPLQVSISTLGEYVMHLKEHGQEKFIADINILLNLKNIYREFTKYQKK